MHETPITAHSVVRLVFKTGIQEAVDLLNFFCLAVLEKVILQKNLKDFWIAGIRYQENGFFSISFLEISVQSSTSGAFFILFYFYFFSFLTNSPKFLCLVYAYWNRQVPGWVEMKPRLPTSIQGGFSDKDLFNLKTPTKYPIDNLSLAVTARCWR